MQGKYTLTHHPITEHGSCITVITLRPYFTPFILRLFCFNTPGKFTPLPNFRPLIFNVRPFGWFTSIYSSIFLIKMFFIYAFLMTPTFVGTLLGHNTKPLCTKCLISLPYSASHTLMF